MADTIILVLNKARTGKGIVQTTNLKRAAKAVVVSITKRLEVQILPPQHSEIKMSSPEDVFISDNVCVGEEMTSVISSRI